MSYLTIDEKKCTKCGTCVAICPVGIIEQEEDSGLPRVKDENKDFCIACGHCVAVCPTAALSLAEMPAAGCAVIEQQKMANAAQFALLAQSRRSIRTYEPRLIAREQIEALIDVARYAPSGINLQPVRWMVIYEKEQIQELNEQVIGWMREMTKTGSPLAATLNLKYIIDAWEQGVDRVCRGAAHVILAYGLKDDMTAQQACVIALSHLELAAHAAGLGACWAGYVHLAVSLSEEVRKSIKLNKRCSAHGAMLVGHPQFQYHRIPQRKQANIVWR